MCFQLNNRGFRVVSKLCFQVKNDKKDNYLFDNRYGIEIIELEEIDILIFGTIRISELQKSAPTF